MASVKVKMVVEYPLYLEVELKDAVLLPSAQAWLQGLVDSEAEKAEVRIRDAIIASPWSRGNIVNYRFAR